MSLARDLIAQLRAALERVAAARAGTATAREQAAEAAAEIRTATDGSTHEKTDEARVRLEQAQIRLDEAAAEFDGGTAAVEEYIAHLERGGSGSAAGGHSPATGGPPPAAQRPHGDTPQASAFRPDRPSGPHVAAIRRVGWPKKPGSDDDVRARGQLYHRDGTPWDADVLIASRRGPASQRTDLREPWASDPDYTTGWHIEGNTTALMVKHQQREAVLYINQAVCGAEEPQDPKRCHSNIAKVLPVGYTLYVHSVQESGWLRRRVYKGTGEAIR